MAAAALAAAADTAAADTAAADTAAAASPSTGEDAEQQARQHSPAMNQLLL